MRILLATCAVAYLALCCWRAEQLVNGMRTASHVKQLLASQHPAWLPSVDDLLEQSFLTPIAPS